MGVQADMPDPDVVAKLERETEALRRDAKRVRLREALLPDSGCAMAALMLLGIPLFVALCIGAVLAPVYLLDHFLPTAPNPNPWPWYGWVAAIAVAGLAVGGFRFRSGDGVDRERYETARAVAEAGADVVAAVETALSLDLPPEKMRKALEIALSDYGAAIDDEGGDSCAS